MNTAIDMAMLTPEERDAQLKERAERRQVMREAKQQRKTYGQDYIAQAGLTLVHIPRVDDEGVYGATPRGGYTVAYRPVTTQGTVIELAVALQHPNDQYDRVEGRYLAARSFELGQRIKLRVPQHYLRRKKDTSLAYVTRQYLKTIFTV